MKYCKFCGKQLVDNAAFCDGCGAQQPSNAAAPSAPVPARPVNYGASPVVAKSKGSGKTGIVIACVAAVVIIAIVAVIAFKKSGSTTLDVERFVSIIPEGVDGYGTIKVDVMRKEMRDFLKESCPELNDAEVNKLSNSIDVKPEKTDSLSNNEKVTIKVKYNDKYFKEKNIKLANEEWTHKFGDDDFGKVQEVDPFDPEYFSVTVSGTAPKAGVKYESSPIDGVLPLKYEMKRDPGNTLDIGDTVTFICADDETRLLGKGYKLSRKEYTYTVEADSVNQRVDSLDMLDEDTISSMKKDAEDVINSRIAEYNAGDTDYVETDELKYEGMILLSPKKDRTNEWSNMIYLIYSLHCSSLTGTDGNGIGMYFDPVTTYIPVEITGIIKHTDNTISYSVENHIDRTSIQYRSNGVLIGYDNPDRMMNVLIKTKTDKYDIEMDKSIKKAFD